MAVLQTGPKHGYAIAKAVREGTSGALKMGEGQLYPALYSLEEAGWVTADWEETETDQPRRIYRLTEDGTKELEQRAKKWHAFINGVNQVLPEVQS